MRQEEISSGSGSSLPAYCPVPLQGEKHFLINQLVLKWGAAQLTEVMEGCLKYKGALSLKRLRISGVAPQRMGCVEMLPI